MDYFDMACSVRRFYSINKFNYLSYFILFYSFISFLLLSLFLYVNKCMPVSDKN